MFTGIIESMGEVVRLDREGTNLHIRVKSALANELKIDQSLAHNGVCLTVVGIEGDTYTVTAVAETLKRSNLGDLKTGDPVNLERAMRSDGRLDGHIVQGHVDGVGEVVEPVPDLRVRVPDGLLRYLVEHRGEVVSRADLLDAVADRIEARLDEFAEMESRDTGKPITAVKPDSESARAFHDIATKIAVDMKPKKVFSDKLKVL